MPRRREPCKLSGFLIRQVVSQASAPRTQALWVQSLTVCAAPGRCRCLTVMTMATSASSALADQSNSARSGCRRCGGAT